MKRALQLITAVVMLACAQALVNSDDASAAGMDISGGPAFSSTVDSVLRYGADNTGTTEATTAIQAAFTARTSVYLPAGTYLVSNLTIPNDGTRIYGDGPSTILKMVTGATGAVITTGTSRVTLEDFALFGGITTSMKAVSTAALARDGISIQPSRDSRIHHVSVYGFARTAVVLATQSADRLTHMVFSDSSLYNNWQAVDITTETTSEFIRFSSLDINYNYYGLRIRSGNFTASNCKINDNGWGVIVDGTNSANNAHGNVNGSLINHNTTAIYALAVTNGFSFTGNNVFEGDVYFKNSYGVNIQAGIIDATTFHLEGGGINYIRNNYVPNAYGNTITHSYNGSADGTLFVDNYTDNGTFLDSRSSLASLTLTWTTQLYMGTYANMPAADTVLQEFKTGSTTSTLVELYYRVPFGSGLNGSGTGSLDMTTTDGTVICTVSVNCAQFNTPGSSNSNSSCATPALAANTTYQLRNKTQCGGSGSLGYINVSAKVTTP